MSASSVGIRSPKFEGQTFYITKKVEGLTLTVPPSCNGNAPAQTFQGYKIFFKLNPYDKIDIDCNVRNENCSWMFLNPNRRVKTVEDGFVIRQRIVQDHFSNATKNTEKPICRAEAPVNGDVRSEPSKVTELDVVKVTFAPAQTTESEVSSPRDTRFLKIAESATGELAQISR